MTLTYYWRLAALANAIHAAASEGQLLTTTTTSTTSSNSLGSGISTLMWCWSSNADIGIAQWGSGTYTVQLNVISVGANLSYGFMTAGSANGHVARVNSGLTSDLETITQNEALFTGTGLKTATFTWTPSAGATTDRVENLLAGTNSGSMTQSLALQMNGAADTYITGPFDAGGPVTFSGVVMTATALSPAETTRADSNFGGVVKTATALSPVSAFLASSNFGGQLITATALSPAGSVRADSVFAGSPMLATVLSPAGLLTQLVTFAGGVMTADALEQALAFKVDSLFGGAIMHADALTPVGQLIATSLFAGGVMPATAVSPAGAFLASRVFLADPLLATALSPAGTLGGGTSATFLAALMTATALSPAASYVVSKAFIAALLTANANSPAGSFNGITYFLAQVMTAMALMRPHADIASSTPTPYNRMLIQNTTGSRRLI